MQPVGTDAAAPPSFSAAPVATAAPVAGPSSGGHDQRRSSSGAVGGSQAVAWGQAAVAMAPRRSQSGPGPATPSHSPTAARPGGVRMSPPHPSPTAPSSAVFPDQQSSRPSSATGFVPPPHASADVAAVNQALQVLSGLSRPQSPVDPRLYTLDMVQQKQEDYLGFLQTLFSQGGSAIEIALQADAVRRLTEAKLPTVRSMLAEFAPDMMVIHGCRPKDYLHVFEEYKSWSHQHAIPTFPLTGATTVSFLVDRVANMEDRVRIVQILELYRAATIDIYLTLGGRQRSDFQLGWPESVWAAWFSFVEQATIRVHEWLAVREVCGLVQPQPRPHPAPAPYYAPPPYPVVQPYSSAPAFGITATAPTYPATTQVPPSAQAPSFAYQPQATNAAAPSAPLSRRQSRQSHLSNPPTPTAPSSAQFQPSNVPPSDSPPLHNAVPLRAPHSKPPSPVVPVFYLPSPRVPNPSAYPHSAQPYPQHQPHGAQADPRPVHPPRQHQASPSTSHVLAPPIIPHQSAAATTSSPSKADHDRLMRNAAAAIAESRRIRQKYPEFSQQNAVDDHRARQPAAGSPSSAFPSQSSAALASAAPLPTPCEPQPSPTVTIASQARARPSDGDQAWVAASPTTVTDGATGALLASASPSRPGGATAVKASASTSGAAKTRPDSLDPASSSNFAAPSAIASAAQTAAFDTTAAPLAPPGGTPAAVAFAQPIASTSAATPGPAISRTAGSLSTQPQGSGPAPHTRPSAFSFPARAALTPADFAGSGEPPQKKRRKRRKGPLLPPDEEAEEDDFYAVLSDLQKNITLYRHEFHAVAAAIMLQKTAHTRVSPWRNGKPDAAVTVSAASLDLETPFGDYIPTSAPPEYTPGFPVYVNVYRDPLNALRPFPGNPPPPVVAKLTSRPFPSLARPDDAFSLAPQPFLSYPDSLRPPDEAKRAQLWTWALGLGDAAQQLVEAEVTVAGGTLDELERAKKAQLGAMVRQAVQGAAMEPLPDVREPKMAKRVRRRNRNIALSEAGPGKGKDSVVLDLVDDQEAQVDAAMTNERAPGPADAANAASPAAPLRPPTSVGTASTPALPTTRPRAGSTGAVRRRASVSGAGVHPLAQYYAQAPGAMRQQLRDMSADIRGVPSDSTAGALAHATARLPALRPNGLSAASPRIGSSKSPALASPPLVPIPLDVADETGGLASNSSGSARQETAEPPVPSGSTALGVIVDVPTDACGVANSDTASSASQVEGGAAAAVGAVASAVGSVLCATVGAVSSAAKAVVPEAIAGKFGDAAAVKLAGGDGDGAHGSPASRSTTPVNATGKRQSRRCKICRSAECQGRWRRDMCKAASRSKSGERRWDKGKGRADGPLAPDEASGAKGKMVAPRLHPCSVRNMRVDWLRASEPVRPFGPFS